MEKVQMIRPATMEFHYQYPLDAYTCYHLHTGTCSLDLPFNDAVEAPNRNPYYQQETACQSLCVSLKQGDTPPVEIIKHDCGHFSFTDGQHRVCIAQRQDLEIPAIISEGGPMCCFCARQSHSKHSETFVTKIVLISRTVLSSFYAHYSQRTRIKRGFAQKPEEKCEKMD